MHRTFSLLSGILFVGVGLLFAGERQSAELQQVLTYIHNRTTADAAESVKHCAFGAQALMQLHLNELDAQTQKLAKTLLEEPRRQKTLVSPSGHFTIHYDTSGYNAVPPEDLSGNGIPDYVDSAAVILDHVWDVEINQLGFAPPPDSSGQPIKSYPIYFTNFSYYGLTSFDLSEDIAALPGDNYTSYIEIDNDFSGSGFYTHGLNALRVTCAHEFNHAIQLGYEFRVQNNSFVDAWFMEMTSTWLEDFVYNGVNDYFQYLSGFFRDADSKPFNRYDGWFEYGNSIYLHMLEKEYGARAVPSIWDYIKNKTAVSAIDAWLNTQKSSFAVSHNQYACWLYFTGSRSQSDRFFPEAADYPRLSVLAGDAALDAPLAGLSMRHISIDVDQKMVYRGRVNGSSGKGMFNQLANNDMPQPGVAMGKTQTFNQQSELPLILVLTNSANEDVTGLTYTKELSPPTLSMNPVLIKKELRQIEFLNVPPFSTIRIFTINGLLVRSIVSDNFTFGSVPWDMKDKLGSQVASGIYLFHLQNKDLSVVGKFSVVRQ